MTSTDTQREEWEPVPRARVGLAALAVLGVLVALGAGLELLRHPPAQGREAVAQQADDASDPRIEVSCPGEVPREGQERDETDDSARTPVTAGSGQLLTCPQLYDSQRVRYTGEVVGAVLDRDDGAWVQLNDDTYALDAGPLPLHRDFQGLGGGIGVFLPGDEVAQIEHVGGPGVRGTVLEVTGVFHRVDPVSAEVTIIQADAATVSSPGGPFDPVDLPGRAVVGLVVAALAVAAVVAERVVSRRR